MNLRAQWYWTLRFALGREADLRKREGDSLLTESLLRYGEPYVVYHAIAKDCVAIDAELESLCRWLVHWTWTSLRGVNYVKAFDEKGKLPEVSLRVASIIAFSFQRRFRNGPALPAAYYLLAYTQSQGPTAEVTKCIEAAKDNLFKDFMGEAPAVDPREVIDWIKTFKKCPPEDWYPHSAHNPGWEQQFANGKMLYRFPYPLREIWKPEPPLATVEPFWVSPMPISNEQWEWFDPGHWFWRDDYSRENSQGVNNVSWYMCALYALWLSKNLETYTATNGGKGVDGGGMQPNRFRLLNEVEWELMARGGGNQEVPLRKDGQLVSMNVEMRIGRTWGATEPERNDVDQFTNAFEVCHPVGDLYNWCGDRKENGSGRSFHAPLEWPSAGSLLSIRGASFKSNYAHISPRFSDVPTSLSRYCGFRLCGSFVVASSETL